jgi:hypothetical protein
VNDDDDDGGDVDDGGDGGGGDWWGGAYADKGSFERVELVSGAVPNFARHTAVAIGTKIWVYGGYDGIGSFFGLALFDTGTPPRTPRTPHTPHVHVCGMCCLARLTLGISFIPHTQRR